MLIDNSEVRLNTKKLHNNPGVGFIEISFNFDGDQNI
jgi:hypothetical protein